MRAVQLCAASVGRHGTQLAGGALERGTRGGIDERRALSRTTLWLLLWWVCCCRGWCAAACCRT